MAILGGLLLAPLLYAAPLLGWDWFMVYFENKESLFWYPPWTSLITSPLALALPWRWGLAISNGLTLSAVAVVTLRESGANNRWGYVGAALAILTPPIAVLLWAGQVDGWGLIGYLLLPWGVPLLLVKPTIGAFALLARKSWFLAGLIFALITFLVWPGWPAQLIGIHVVGEFDHMASMGWYKLSWPITLLGLVLMLFTNRKDPMHLMAAGVFLMPYVFPYHLVLLLPTLGRFTYLRQLLLWLCVWLMALPFALGSQWAWSGYVFPLVVWFLLWQEAPKESTWWALLRRLTGKFQERMTRQKK